MRANSGKTRGAVDDSGVLRQREAGARTGIQAEGGPNYERTNELVVLRHLICGEYGCRIRQMCVCMNPLQHRKIIELFLCS